MARATPLSLVPAASRSAVAVPGVVVVAFLALAVRAWRAAGNAVISDDTRTYVALARKVASGQAALVEAALNHPYHPGTSLLMAGLSPLAGGLHEAGLAAAVACGALTVVPLWLLARELVGREAALVAALFLAVTPDHVKSTSHALSEGPYYLCWTFAAWLALRALRRAGPPAAFFAGLAAGLAYLFRPEGAGVVLAGLALAVAPGPFLAGVGAGRRTAFVAALAAGFLLCAAPYAARTGSFTRKIGGLERMLFDAGRGAPGPASALTDEPRSDGDPLVIDPFEPPPRPFVRPGVPRAAGEVGVETMAGQSYVLTIFTLAGLGTLLGAPGRLSSRERGAALFLLTLGVVVVASLVFVRNVKGYFSGRHVEALVIMLMPLAGLGAARLGRALARSSPSRPRPAPARGVWLVAALVAAPLGAWAARPVDADKAALVEAGPLIRAALSGAEGADAGIVATPRASRAAFYGGLDDLPLFWEEARAEQVIPTMRRHGWRYLLITWNDLHDPRRADFRHWAELLEGPAWRVAFRTREWERAVAEGAFAGDFATRVHVALLEPRPETNHE
ncbi:MAG: glycosyltransferase family 39 protein [Planctomycetes bacterium]|nr:glycosyltransferase family 39 protein [Planctomycetota bacterium]